MTKTYRRRIGLVIITALLWGAWAAAPQVAVWSMALASKKGEESSREACDRIVFFGERAIPSIIAGIEEHTPWVRRYCYLPIALGEIGGTAREQLMEAINKQQDPMNRACLISALQTAFNDYSQVGRILDDMEAQQLNYWALAHLGMELRYGLPDAPPLLTEDRQPNPAFRSYWLQRENRNSKADDGATESSAASKAPQTAVTPSE